jgi:hypothetical protein
MKAQLKGGRVWVAALAIGFGALASKQAMASVTNTASVNVQAVVALVDQISLTGGSDGAGDLDFGTVQPNSLANANGANTQNVVTVKDNSSTGWVLNVGATAGGNYQSGTLLYTQMTNSLAGTISNGFGSATVIPAHSGGGTTDTALYTSLPPDVVTGVSADNDTAAGVPVNLSYNLDVDKSEPVGAKSWTVYYTLVGQ